MVDINYGVTQNYIYLSHAWISMKVELKLILRLQSLNVNCTFSFIGWCVYITALFLQSYTCILCFQLIILVNH